MRAMRSLLVSITALTALICAAIAADTPAGPAGPAGPAVRVYTEYAGDLPNASGKRLTAIVVIYPPGTKSGPHRHHAFVFAQVLSGSIKSQVAGQKLHVYRAGEHWVEAPGVRHIVSENASATQTARLLVVFVADQHAVLDEPDRPPSNSRNSHSALR